MRPTRRDDVDNDAVSNMETQSPKYFSVVIIAFQKLHSLLSLLLRRVQHNNNHNNKGVALVT